MKKYTNRTVFFFLACVVLFTLYGQNTKAKLPQGQVKADNDSSLSYQIVSQNEVKVSGGALNKMKGKIVIPNEVTINGRTYSVTQLGSFYGCEEMTELCLPKSIKRISSYPFSYCSALERISIDEENAFFKSVDGVVYSKSGKTLVLFPNGRNTATFSIPEGVDTIGVFYTTGIHVKTVVVPASVLVLDATLYSMSLESVIMKTFFPPMSPINAAVYSSNQNLTLYVPIGSLDNYKNNSRWNTFNTIMEMDIEGADDDPFEYSLGKNGKASVKAKNMNVCGKMVIPEWTTVDGTSYPITGIAGYAFTERAITEVTIPASVTSIGAYSMFSCSSLSAIYIKHYYPIEIGENVFGPDVYKNTTLYVPLGSKEFYQNTDNWKKFANIQETMMPGVDNQTFAFTILENGTVSVRAANQRLMGSILIPEEVEIDGTKHIVAKIERRAFADCRKITEIRIPKTVNEIDHFAFSGCTKLTRLIVDSENNTYNSVGGVIFKSSGNTLFCYPEGKTEESYAIAEGVDTIYSYAFYKNTYLKSVRIPITVSYIGDAAFENCSSLFSVIIENYYPPSYLLGSFPFSGEGSNKRVYYVPTGAKEFYKKVWGGLNIQEEDMEYVDSYPLEFSILNGGTALAKTKYKNVPTNVVIPDEVEIEGQQYLVTTVGMMSSYITGITIPRHANNIDYGALRGCKYLTSITVRKNYPFELTSSPFQNDIYTKATLYVPKGSSEVYRQSNYWKQFKKIEEVEMEGISDSPIQYKVISDTEVAVVRVDNRLKGSIELPSTTTIKGQTYTVVRIDAGAFYGCKGLMEVVIPKTVTGINTTAFRDCENMERITVEKGNQRYQSLDGVLHTANGKTILYYPQGKRSEAYVVAEGVEVVDYEVFSGCIYLKSVNIPASLKTIYSIFSCPQLEEIVVSPDNYMFKSADGVLFSHSGRTLYRYPCGKNANEYIIPERVDTISSHAFASNHFLESVTIPTSVYNLGTGIFSECDLLTLITSKIVNPPLDVTSITKENYKKATLYVPTGTLAIYQNTSGWKDFNMTEKEMEDIEEGYFVFTVLDDKEVSARLKNTNIMGEVIVPETTIVDEKNYTIAQFEAFSNCPKVTGLTLPKTVSKIVGTFDQCEKLARFAVDTNSPYFYSQADVLFSYNGKTLYAYPSAKQAEHYEIPQGVETIKNLSFNRNPFLKSVTIPSSVRLFGSMTFWKCESITSVILKQGSPTDGHCSADMFSDENYQNATLYVPKGRSRFFRQSVVWGLFTHIEEMDMPDVVISSSPFHSIEDNQMILAYDTSEDYVTSEDGGSGGSQAGIYKMCMGINNRVMDPFAGNQITHVRFALVNTELASVKVWIGSSRYNEPLYEQTVTTLTKGWNDVKLNKPFILTGDSIFVGIEYQLSGESFPISCVRGGDPGSCYVYGPYDNGKSIWFDSDDHTLNIQCLVEGDHLPQYHAQVTQLTLTTAPASKYFTKDDLINGYVYIRNWGKRHFKHCQLNFLFDGAESKVVDGDVYTQVKSYVDKTASVFSLKIPDGIQVGRHTFDVTLATIESNKPQYYSGDPLSSTFRLYGKSMERQKNLLQLYTATWCPTSPIIKSQIDSEVSKGDIALVSSHSNDELTCDAATAYNVFAQHYPQVFYDRFAFDGDSIGLYPLTTYERKSLPSFADVNISAFYDEVTRNLAIKVKGIKNEDFDPVIGDANLTVLLTEDSIVAPQLDRDKGEIPNYVHNGVLRTNVSSIWGDPIVWNGDNYEMDYSVRLDDSWIKNNMKIVAFISKPFTGKNYGELHVVNCNDFSLNSAHTEIVVSGDLNDDGEVDVTDVVELIDMVLAGSNDPAGDINGDGEVDVTDVVELIDIVLGN